MFKVIQFEVLHKETDAHYSDNDPHRLIRFFTEKGYGFHNWTIKMQINDIHKSWTEISLLTFNLLTDNWDSVKA
jgi:hypothetical protein